MAVVSAAGAIACSWDRISEEVPTEPPGKSDLPVAQPRKTGSGTPSKPRYVLRQSLHAWLADSKEPGLLGPFANTRLGMPMSEVLEALGTVAHTWHPTTIDPVAGEVPYRSYESDAGPGLHALELELVAEHTAQLEKAWGQPLRVPRKSSAPNEIEALIWLNPAERIRARLDPQRMKLTIEGYTPFVEMIGATPGHSLAVEKPHPFLGASTAEIQEAYAGQVVGSATPASHPASYDSVLMLRFPPSELDDQAWSVRLFARQGRVVGIRFCIRHLGDDESKRTIRAALGSVYAERSDVVVDCLEREHDFMISIR